MDRDEAESVSEDQEKSTEGKPTGTEVQAEAPKAGGPLNVLLPADQHVWAEARRLAAGNVRVEDLAFCATQDPVIALELIHKSNAMFFAGSRSQITSPKAAITRLGSDVVIECLEKVKERVAFDDEDVSHWFEVHRGRGKRISIVATILAEALARNLVEDCQTAGLFYCIGEMLAVAHFRGTYVKLAEEHSRSGVNYRLATDLKFDTERVGLTYLRRQGVPETLLFTLDREAVSRSPDRAASRPIVQAAAELVEAFDSNRWEKLAPGKKLAPKSAIRLLKITDGQYLKVYERASEYLFSARLLEERKKQQDAVRTLNTPAVQRPVAAMTSEQAALDAEINSLLFGPPTVEARTVPRPALEPAKAAETKIKEVSDELKATAEQFSLNPKKKTKSVPRVTKKAATKKAAPQLTSKKGSAAVSSIDSMFNTTNSSEQLLTELLSMLVDNGPFKQSALIVVSKDRKNAIVVAARGPNLGNGQKLLLEDPLSPLAQCFSRVQSFGSEKSSKDSPFGSKAYALAPIDADHETPVALYADCGNDGKISFEARRVFRTVVELLNERLPQVPGGIPVELSQ